MNKVVHELKSWHDAFQATWDGMKRFDYRKNDRNFRVGDELILYEIDKDSGERSGRRLRCLVLYILHGPLHGVPEGYAVLSIRVVGRVGVSSDRLTRA